MKRLIGVLAATALAIATLFTTTVPAQADVSVTSGLFISITGGSATECVGCASSSGGTTRLSVSDTEADGHRVVGVYSVAGLGTWECHNTSSAGSTVSCQMPRKSSGCQVSSLRVEIREGSQVIRKSDTASWTNCW